MAHDLLQYRGQIGPEDLTEPVTFRSSVPSIVIAACVLGVAAWTAMFVGAVMVATVFQTWDHWRGMMVAITAFAVLFGIVSCVRNLSRFGGLTMTVSQWGITVMRAGASIQSCAWSEMTALVSGKGLRRHQRLADQYGQPFPTFGVESYHVDRKLALRLMALQAKELAGKPARVQYAKKPAYSSVLAPDPNTEVPMLKKPGSRAVWLGVPAMALGAASMAGAALARNGLVATSGDPDASFAVRAGWLTLLLVSGLGLAVGFVGFGALLVVFLQRIPVQESRRHLVLRAFVSDRKGRFEPAKLVNGMWFRYPDPEGLRATDSSGSTAVCLTIFGLMYGVFPIWIVGGLTPVSAAVAAFGLLSIWAAFCILTNRSQLHRALTCRVRRLDDAYEIDDGLGRRITCRVVSEPKPRPASHQFGAMALVLRGDNGQIYRIDPRFLEEAPQD